MSEKTQNQNILSFVRDSRKSGRRAVELADGVTVYLMPLSAQEVIQLDEERTPKPEDDTEFRQQARTMRAMSSLLERVTVDSDGVRIFDDGQLMTVDIAIYHKLMGELNESKRAAEVASKNVSGEASQPATGDASPTDSASSSA